MRGTRCPERKERAAERSTAEERGERREQGAREDEEQECGFQVCAKLRNLKGREGGSARQTGKQRERKWNNYRKPDQESEKRGKPLRWRRCRKAGRRESGKEGWEQESGSKGGGEQSWAKKGRGGGGRVRRWNKQNTTQSGKEPLKECLPYSRKNWNVCVLACGHCPGNTVWLLSKLWSGWVHMCVACPAWLL